MNEWMKNVRKVEPYVPGEQPQVRNVIKLNTNENPYPPAPGVQRAIAAVDDDRLRRYPDPDCRSLIRTLADYYQVKENQVFVGVGSDDVLATAFMTFFASDQPILFPDISYAFYEVWAEMMRIPYRKIPLNGDLRINAQDYCVPNGGIVFPNPNAPTSILEPLSFIEGIATANPGSVVIVDEAYIDFGGESALPLISRYDNLLITQTFSKSRALAGMRIGYAIGQPALIAAMMAVRNSYNSYTMNQTALDAGVAAIKDEAYFRAQLKKITDTRAEAVLRLAELGFTGPEPMANFLFVTHERIPAAEIFQKLKNYHVYVRYFNKPRINNYLRITVGTPEQMEALYRLLEEIVSAS